VLTGESASPAHPDRLDEAAKPEDAMQGERDLISRLEHSLTHISCLEVARGYQKLQVKLNVGEEIVVASVSYNTVTGMVHIRAELPFVESAALELLSLFGHDDFTGTLCVSRIMQASHFVVRRTIDTARHPVGDIDKAVQQLLSEVVRAKEVLREFQ
jgi:hypothetical protein